LVIAEHDHINPTSIDLPKKDYAETLGERSKYMRCRFEKTVFQESLDSDVETISELMEFLEK